MSGNSLPADEANLLRCCQKGLLDFDAGESRAPISRFQRIFNVSSSASRHSSSRDKEIWFCPKIDFSWIFPGFSPESFGNFFFWISSTYLPHGLGLATAATRINKCYFSPKGSITGKYWYQVLLLCAHTWYLSHAPHAVQVSKYCKLVCFGVKSWNVVFFWCQKIWIWCVFLVSPENGAGVKMTNITYVWALTQRSPKSWDACTMHIWKVGGGHLNIGEGGTDSDSPFHSNWKDWSLLSQNNSSIATA